jgi:hypothetical protein
MGTEHDWTIPEEDLKKAFGKLRIEEEFYPVFKERALYRLNEEDDDYDDGIENASEYTIQYATQIKKGKSPLYAIQYAKHHFENEDEDFCDFYASKYEESIKKGRDRIASIRIAEACERRFNLWPNDNNLLGKEAIKGYMTGFEYGIDKKIDSPEEFAEEYLEVHLSKLFPDEKDPPYRIKRKYDDIIKKIFPIKSEN